MKESDYQKSGISALLIHIYLGYILSNSVLVVDDILHFIDCNFIVCNPKPISNTIVYID